MKLPLGNSKPAQALIVLFIVILLGTLAKCAAAEPSVDFGLGASATHGPGAPVAELDYHFPIGFTGTDAPTAWVGTTLLGAQQGNQNNWAWHAGIEGHKGRFSAGIGFAYLARVDGLNGQHANYTLTMAYRLTDRFSVRYRHFSDAGTSAINQGRDMLELVVRLR